MRGILKLLYRGICGIIIFALANYYSLNAILKNNFMFFILFIMFVIINFIPSLSNRNLETRRLKVCGDGCELLILFCISTIVTIVYYVAGLSGDFNGCSIIENPMLWIINTILAIIIEGIIFWNGISRVYMTSVQLGIRMRVIGIICGWIPIANIIALGVIISKVSKEVLFENSRIVLNARRKSEEICKTKYPVLLVHGVFFRDFRYFNYWGRIPKDLEQNGAKIFYGNHQSAASVENSANELMDRIKEILKETGAEKVNVIAHSKGGLDTRYAISMLGGDEYIASLTTINTPHRGCLFADYLLSKIPQKQKDAVANAYNNALRKLGDFNPDFISAVIDLTSSACLKRNEFVVDVEGVYYQSFGSKLNASYGGRFPLNFSYLLVRYFDGHNDGLVGEESFPWGEKYTFITVNGKRGVSHGDIIDLNRENIYEFDIREFYVKLVNGLKNKGF
ncbi:MAG: esterase/lipase family protein [Clostridium sp.]